MLRKMTIFKASTHALIETRPNATLGDEHPKLCEHNAVVIVNPEGEFRGILTRKDAVRVILDREDWADVPVHDIMTHRVLHVPSHISVAEAADIMLEEDVHQLVITGPPEGGGVVVGIVTLQDVIRNAA